MLNQLSAQVEARINIRDRWRREDIEGITGWAIGDGTTAEEADALYTKLEQVVMPMFVARWAEKVQERNAWALCQT